MLSQKLAGDLDLLKRHVEMLMLISDREPIGIIKLADALNIPEHRVRYSLRLLEQDGLIVATRSGARITKKTDYSLKELGSELGNMTDTISDIRQALESVD